MCNLFIDAPAPCLFVQLIVGDSIGPDDLVYSYEVSVVEHFHSPRICFDHSPAFRTVQQNRLDVAVV